MQVVAYLTILFFPNMLFLKQACLGKLHQFSFSFDMKKGAKDWGNTSLLLQEFWKRALKYGQFYFLMETPANQKLGQKLLTFFCEQSLPLIRWERLLMVVCEFGVQQVEINTAWGIWCVNSNKNISHQIFPNRIYIYRESPL